MHSQVGKHDPVSRHLDPRRAFSSKPNRESIPKIDKGCLIVEHFEKGFYVLTFDRAGSESRFWVRDFLGVRPIPDSALLTKRVAEMAVTAVSPESPDADSPPWEVNEPAREALSYLRDQKQFSLQEFEENALRTEAAKARFAEERQRVAVEEGLELKDQFELSKRDISKPEARQSVMKLDTGVEVRLKPKVVDKPGGARRALTKDVG